MIIAKEMARHSSRNINICTELMETSLIYNINLRDLLLIITSLLRETIIVTPLLDTLTRITIT